MKATAASVLVAVALGVQAAQAADATAPQRIQVVEDEWTLTLSRQSLRAGYASIETVNFGMDVHDLVIIRKAPGAKPIRFPKLDPRTHAERRIKLPAGTYMLWCSLPNHRQRGMRATLRVR